MKAQSAYFRLGIVKGFDALEVHTVVLEVDDYASALFCGDEIPEDSAVCWSLYGHICNEGLECIGDYTSFESACAIAEKLGGVKFDQKIS